METSVICFTSRGCDPGGRRSAPAAGFQRSPSRSVHSRRRSSLRSPPASTWFPRGSARADSPVHGSGRDRRICHPGHGLSRCSGSVHGQARSFGRRRSPSPAGTRRRLTRKPIRLCARGGLRASAPSARSGSHLPQKPRGRLEQPLSSHRVRAAPDTQEIESAHAFADRPHASNVRARQRLTQDAGARAAALAWACSATSRSWCTARAYAARGQSPPRSSPKSSR